MGDIDEVNIHRIPFNILNNGPSYEVAQITQIVCTIAYESFFSAHSFVCAVQTVDKERAVHFVGIPMHCQVFVCTRRAIIKAINIKINKQIQISASMPQQQFKVFVCIPVTGEFMYLLTCFLCDEILIGFAKLPLLSV